MKNSIIEQLRHGSARLNLHLSETAIEQLEIYSALLKKWNLAYNLVSDASDETILHEHLLDSLSVAAYIDGQRIIDIGTGAGLPGIPLAIAFPEKSFTLLDSIGKKTRFLIQVKAELKLTNVEIVQGRAESYAAKNCFDTIISRAVTSAQAMINLTQHLLCPNGKILMMKGRIPTEELQELAWRYHIHPLTVPYLNKERHLVVLERN